MKATTLICGLTLLLAGEANAITCQLAYQTDNIFNEPILSNPAVMTAVPGTRASLTASFLPDGVIRHATATFQPTGAGVGTMNLIIEVDNGSNGMDQETQYLN